MSGDIFLRYAQNLTLGISSICLWLNFSHALILNENSYFSRHPKGHDRSGVGLCQEDLGNSTILQRSCIKASYMLNYKDNQLAANWQRAARTT